MTDLDLRRSVRLYLMQHIGTIRYVMLVIDCGPTMQETDFPPTRGVCAQRISAAFVRRFLARNALSQIGIYLAGDVTNELSPLSANEVTLQRLLTQAPFPAYDNLCLSNALSQCEATLSSMPEYGTREIIVLMSSLNMVEREGSDDIQAVLKRLQDNKIRTSFISLSAELHICKRISQLTNGQHGVAQGPSHAKRLIMQHIYPPATSEAEAMKRDWVKFGFASRKLLSAPSLCACHNKFRYQGVECPQCKALHCSLPIDCRVCRLPLVSAPHLARSYHSLFPLPAFVRTTLRSSPGERVRCCGCNVSVRPPQKSVPVECLSCPKCHGNFCDQCDTFVHEVLHACPSCLLDH
ncbi:MAG: hypothetical protein MHM6MM_007854 [Cercozoa sp. M6MM]